MQIETLFTGSSGNAYKISCAGTSILIDAGVPIRKIKESLNFGLCDIAGVLISHSHLDHCKAVPDLLNFGVPCHMLQEVKDTLNLRNAHNLNVFDFNDQFKIGKFTVLPFELEHDVPNAGFLIQPGAKKLVYITDSYYCKYRFIGLTHIMLEINYNDEILDENIKRGIVHPSMRKRLLYSHFSLKNAKDFLLASDLTKCEEIHLIHRSKRNADPGFLKTEIEKLTGVPVFIK